MTLEELQVIITAKTQGLQKELKNVSKQLKGLETNTSQSMKNLQNSVNKATSGVAGAAKKLKTALIALGIGKVLKDSFDMARTYEASVQQVNRMFGLYSGAINAWVEKNAKTFGMARADAMKYASIYGNLVRAFEQDGSKMTYYTTELMKATTIVASSTGRTVQDVSERIRSGILGNTEAIEDLGIYAQVAMLKTSNAFKQVADGRSWDKLTFQEQQQIRVMSILEQASSQFGDSIQHNMNYSLMMLTANLKNVWLNLGQAFMPIVNAVLPMLNAMAESLERVTARLATFMNALFGTEFNQGAGMGASTGQGFDSMASSAENAGKEAEKAGKKAKKALMGFDEVNVLNQGSSEGEGGSNASGGAANTLDPVQNKLEDAAESFADKLKAELERIKNLFKEGFEIGIGGDYKKRLQELYNFIPRIKEALKGIFDGDVKESFKNLVDSWIFSAGQTVGAWASIGITIATNLVGGVTEYLEQNGQFIKERLLGMLNVGEEIAVIWGEWVTTFADIFSVLGGETGQQITANIIGMFTNGFLGATELALKFGRDILDCITGPIIANKDKIKEALENTLKPIGTITEMLKDLVTNTFQSILNAYDTYIAPAYQNIKEGLTQVVEALLDAYNTHIAPTIDKIANTWREFYDKHLQPVINKAIDVLGKFVLAVSELYKNCLAPFVAWCMDYMAPYVAAAFENISEAFRVVAEFITDTVGGLLDVFGGIIDFLRGVFKGDWELVWSGIKQYYKGICDTFKAIFINPLKNGLEWLQNTFTRGWQTSWDGCKKIFKGVFDSLVNIAKGPINLIIEAINTMIRGMNKFQIDIPDWVSNIPGLSQYGGQSIGFSIPTIPKLARGGIVDGATFMGNYIAGEAGAEMIVPLENTSFVSKLANALGAAVFNAMNTNNTVSDNGTPLILEIDGREIARTIITPLDRELKRKGVVLGAHS